MFAKRCECKRTRKKGILKPAEYEDVSVLMKDIFFAIRNYNCVSAMLHESDAIILYLLKIDASTNNQSKRGRSGPISKLFGVSARTVRDIWNRKTWAYATKHLWACEDSFGLGGEQNNENLEVLIKGNISATFIE